MKSETLTVRQLFQDRRQYCVPFYQRAYVWTLRNQWNALWQDIQEKAQARVSGLSITPHFLGGGGPRTPSQRRADGRRHPAHH